MSDGILPPTNWAFRFPNSDKLFPHPFLDPASLALPTNIKQIFKLSKYFYLTNPLVSAAIYKMAEYPITELMYDTPNSELAKLYRTILEDHIDIKKALIEIGIDYNVYGIVFLTLIPPFKRKFVGKTSKKLYTPELDESGQPNWTVRDKQLVFKPNYEPVDIIDEPVKSYDFHLVRWDPMQIEIDYNEFADHAEYYYTISNKARRAFSTSPLWIRTTPKVFLEAWLQGKSAIKFNPANLVVIKRPSPSMEYKGWGMPLLVHVLQTLHYQQMLRRAQYAIAKDRMLPLRYIFPPAELLNQANPMSINLAQWREKMIEALNIWRFNPNYIGIFPVPVQQGALTGEGKQLLLFPELQALSEELIQGLQVPIEFIRGGLSWSGSSVSLRMLENHFLNYRQGLKSFLRYLVRVISTHLEIEPIDLKLKPFKMADDIQRKQLLQTLFQLGVISKSTLLENHELSYEKEFEKIKKESKDMVELQQLQQAASQPSYEDMLVPENVSLGEAATPLMRQQLLGTVPPPDQQSMQPLPEKNPPRRRESPI